MMRASRIQVGLGLLLAAALACASPLATAQPQPTVNLETAVAGTLQALATATKTAAPTPLASPLPANPLLRSLNFLNKDGSGRSQVYRLERDGRTTQQITFEPAAVDWYDVSPVDGSLVYISNNQLLWVDVNGAGRRVLVDGGVPPADNNFMQRISAAVWSPDGMTVAYGFDGLNFYAMATGLVDRVLSNQVDTSAGFPIVRELYWPSRYSPDGSRLLISVGYNEAGTFAIYDRAKGSLLRFTRPDGGLVCCTLVWLPDGSGLYAANPTMGMLDSGLWYIDAATGNVSTLLPGAAPDGTYNFAEAPLAGPDGKLYFFFANLPQIPTDRTPLYMARADPDGVTARTLLQPDAFKNISEILWAPDASLALLAIAPAADVHQGGQVAIVYSDGRPSVVLLPYAAQMRWGQ